MAGKFKLELMENLMNQVDLNKYKEFVEGVTSHKVTKQNRCNQLQSLEQQGVNMVLLLTGSIGIAVKEANQGDLLKCIPRQALDADTQFKNESWVIFRYWIHPCRALGP